MPDPLFRQTLQGILMKPLPRRLFLKSTGIANRIHKHSALGYVSPAQFAQAT